MDEVERIKLSYGQRGLDLNYPKFSDFQHHSRCEREYWLDYFLTKHFKNFESLKFLEVGAGPGGNLSSFFRLGIRRENIYANDLLSDRGQALSQWISSENIHVGDARSLNWDNFDVIYQSMLFSSVLNEEVRHELAKTIWRALKPGGLLLWYDMLYNNPSNPNIRGIKRTEIQKLFPEATIESRRITMAPPLGRRVGRLYPYLNFPFLRTHVLSALKKP